MLFRGGKDVRQVGFRENGFVDGAEGFVHPVFREIAHPEKPDFRDGGFHLHSDIALFRGHAVSVLESALETEVIGPQDDGSRAPFHDAETGPDVEDALRGRIQRKFLGANPLSSFPCTQFRAHEARLEARDCIISDIVLVPHGKVHRVAVFGLQGHPLVRNVHATVALHFPGIPQFTAVGLADDGKLISRLLLASDIGFHPPTEQGVTVFDGEGFVGMLDPEVLDGSGGQRQDAPQKQAGKESCNSFHNIDDSCYRQK